jgi:hypothetical protein
MAGGIIHLEKTTILSHPHAPALYNRDATREIDAVMNFFVTDQRRSIFTGEHNELSVRPSRRPTAGQQANLPPRPLRPASPRPWRRRPVRRPQRAPPPRLPPAAALAAP